MLKAYTTKIMKLPKTSICFTPSKVNAQRLKDFSQVAGVAPATLVNDILEAVLAPAPDGGWLFAGSDALENLQRYLHRKQYPAEEAKALAANYNVYALKESQCVGSSIKNEAQVEPKPNAHGLFRVWFPVIRRKAA
jgi:hypothetical protein